jgi:hypothetical protein
MNDPEIKAIGAISEALNKLSEEQQSNVLLYINARYAGQTVGRSSSAGVPTTGLGAEKFESLGDFFDALDPQTEADRVLAVGYWLQVVQGASDFESFPVNKELKNLGHTVSNITRALDTLISQTPRLVLQVSKTGSSKQSRKKYKITREGIKRVQAALKQDGGDDNGG